MLTRAKSIHAVNCDSEHGEALETNTAAKAVNTSKKDIGHETKLVVD